MAAHRGVLLPTSCPPKYVVVTRCGAGGLQRETTRLMLDQGLMPELYIITQRRMMFTNGVLMSL